MSDLTDFLLARIAEDEQALEDAAVAEAENLRRDGLPNSTAAEVREYWLRPPGSTGDPVEDQPTPWRRWLAECEAKRRITELAIEHQGYVDHELGGPDTDPDEIEILRVLAVPYADHPDYREEWQPDTSGLGLGKSYAHPDTAEMARREGAAHREQFPGHNVVEDADHPNAEQAITLTCRDCTWFVSWAR